MALRLDYGRSCPAKKCQTNCFQWLHTVGMVGCYLKMKVGESGFQKTPWVGMYEERMPVYRKAKGNSSSCMHVLLVSALDLGLTCQGSALQTVQVHYPPQHCLWNLKKERQAQPECPLLRGAEINPGILGMWIVMIILHRWLDRSRNCWGDNPLRKSKSFQECLTKEGRTTYMQGFHIE